jgi:CRP-like cAMP-binding protein
VDYAAARGFRALVSSTAWAALVQGGVKQTYPAGKRLLIQGEPGGWLIVLVNGRVKVLYSGPAGGELLLAVRGPGDVLGEFAGVDDGPRSATIQTMEGCIGVAWPEPRFAEFVRQHRLSSQLDRYVMAKVRQTAGHAWQLSHHSPSQRLAALFCDVVAAAGPDHQHPLQIPMSQEELAEAIGVARSSVTPLIADWRRAGLISTGRARITVRDPDKLLAVVNSRA